MRRTSVNSEISVRVLAGLLFLFVLGFCLPTGAEPSSLESRVDSALACHQRAILLEVGLVHLSEEEKVRQRSRLNATMVGIDQCVSDGKKNMALDHEAWQERVRRANLQKKHSASHLREAALRSTVFKLLKRTEVLWLRLRVVLAKD
jgi:hypothetical protein